MPGHLGPRTANRVHRAMADYGEPVTIKQLVDLLDGPTNDAVRQALNRLDDVGYARVDHAVQSPRGGRPEAWWVLTDSGRENIPAPGAHAPLGHTGSRDFAKHRDDPTDYRNQPGVAPVVGATVRSIGFPLLDALRARSKTRAALMAALESLPDGDDLRSTLRARINQLDRLAPIEAEYLRYAQAHPHGRPA